MDMDLIDSFDLGDIEDIGLLELPQRSNRLHVNRIRVNPFSELSDADFKSKYRFTKRFAMKIVDLLRDDLSLDPRGSSLPPEMQVVCAIRCWARHEIQDDAADLHGVSQPYMSKVCKKVAGAIASKSHRFIKMPATLEEQESTMRNFRSIANFPMVIGAIDCTHIRVRKLSADGGQLYVNRKGYPSINVQVVCDANLKIMDIVTRWRGSVHDSRIFPESRLKQRFEASAFSGILLGDNGYPCSSYLFTPVLNPRTAQEQNYNRAYIRTRNTVERCFGVLKQRFRCLLRGMFCDIETAKKTIVACAVLHNIAIDMKEDLLPDEIDSDQVDSSTDITMPPVAYTLRGNIRRRQFIENHF